MLGAEKEKKPPPPQREDPFWHGAVPWQDPQAELLGQALTKDRLDRHQQPQAELGRPATGPKHEAENPYTKKFSWPAEPFYLDQLGGKAAGKGDARGEERGVDNVAGRLAAAHGAPGRNVMQGSAATRPGPRLLQPEATEAKDRPSRGGAAPASGPRLLDEEDLRNVVVVGTWKPHVRASVSTVETLQVELVGMDGAVLEVLPGPEVPKVIRVRLRTQADVTAVISRLRQTPMGSEIARGGEVWANRARSQEENARVGPISRGVRALHGHLEALRLRGETPEWRPDRDYTPGGEAIYVQTLRCRQEYQLLWRDNDGKWIIDDEIHRALGLADTPQEWLAALL